MGRVVERGVTGGTHFAWLDATSDGDILLSYLDDGRWAAERAKGSFLNEPLGAHPAVDLDRLKSFLKSDDGRGFSTGASSTKGNVGSVQPLSHSLMLEPITLGEQKYSWSGELRRALVFTFGSFSEDSAFVAACSKPTTLLPVEELKRIRGNIKEGIVKARIRVRRFDDSSNKLVAHLGSQKQQINERLSGSSLLKIGAQSQRNSSDLMTQKLDDKGKNFLSKRARTPVADMRVEGRSSGIVKQHTILGKDNDMIREGVSTSDLIEEKSESWDKKMRRKRSMSNAFPRTADGCSESKGSIHGRLINESGLPSSEAHIFRSGSFTAVAGSTKPEDASSPSDFGVHPASKNQIEHTSFSVELAGINKERILQKGNSRLNMRDGGHSASPRVTKGKASRASRAASTSMGNPSTSLSHISSTLEDMEQPLDVNKIQPIGGVNIRRRAPPSDDLSPPMAQWVGQRPQKISRRRVDVLSPTSNDGEAPDNSEVCVASDCNTKSSGIVDSSLPVQNVADNAPQLKVKDGNTSSPSRLSESEEIGAADNQSDRVNGSLEADEKGVNGAQHTGSPGLLSKKNKLFVGEGVRRQGRTGRVASFSRGNMSVPGEKLDSPVAARPLQSTKLSSDKNGSKSGRPPSKKHSERKGFSRLALVPNGYSLDGAGSLSRKSSSFLLNVESGSDREDLLAAALIARNSDQATSIFWKNMEPLFSTRVYDRSCLLQLRGKGVMTNRLESTRADGMANQGQDIGFSCNRGTEEDPKHALPLYQRLLSALVVEEGLEELEQNDWDQTLSFSFDEDRACSPGGIILCNGDRGSSAHVPFGDGLSERDDSYMHTEFGGAADTFVNCLDGPLPQKNLHSDFSSAGQYTQMSMDKVLLAELRSIGLYLETKDHPEGEDDIFSKDILALKKQLHQLTDKKISCLDKPWKAVETEREPEERALEQVAMDRLVELAYKKLLATRGSTAARLGISKVPRSVALSFLKRTLARCRKFEETGKSCFSDPALWEIIFAAQPRSNAVQSTDPTGHNFQAKLPGPYSGFSAGSEALGFRNDKLETVPFQPYDALPHQSDHAFAINGPILNRGKKKEVLLDDVSKSSAFRSSAPVGNFIVGAKGKRGDRERDKDFSSPYPVGKFDPLSTTSIRGDQKAKSKAKQKAGQLSTHPGHPLTRDSSELVTNKISSKGKDPTSSRNILDSSKDCVESTNLPMLELGSVELAMVNYFGAHQDLSSWLNIDDDIVLDNDSVGLEIPMDDLSELSVLF